jgi:hypothetical protein
MDFITRCFYHDISSQVQQIAQAAQQLQQLQKAQQQNSNQHNTSIPSNTQLPQTQTTPPNNSHIPASLLTPSTPSSGGLTPQHLKTPRLLEPSPEETTDLEELEQFAKTFKQRRIKLGKLVKRRNRIFEFLLRTYLRVYSRRRRSGDG